MLIFRLGGFLETIKKSQMGAPFFLILMNF